MEEPKQGVFKYACSICGREQVTFVYVEDKPLVCLGSPITTGPNAHMACNMELVMGRLNNGEQIKEA